MAGKPPGRQEITGITRWLISQVNQLEIDLQLGKEADVKMVLDLEPDVVIVATGSTPKNHPFPGDYGPPEVVTTWQVLNKEIEIGDRVLLIDQDGHHQATGTAELLADQGRIVHMITPALFVGGQLGPLQDLFLARQRLESKDISFTPDIAVLEINKTLVKGLNVYSNEIIDFHGYDTIVLAVGNDSADDLYFELKGRIPQLYRIGDCVSPRKTDMAIVEGHRIGNLI
jgi:hypothetical protein